MNAWTKPLGRARWAVAAALALACTDDPVGQYAPITAECDACLSTEPSGCIDTWTACRELAACDDHVACQLNAGCYEDAPGSTCADDAGCELGDDPDGESEAASAAFEACARTTCRDACGFSEP